MLKNLNDGIEQNDNLSLESVRFAWGTTPIAWEKIRPPTAKSKLPFDIHEENPGSRSLNEESEQNK